MKTRTRGHCVFALLLPAVIGTVACEATPTPTAPTASPSVAVTSLASVTDLGACFGGSQAASCFTANRVAAASVGAAQPIVNSAPPGLSASVNGNTVTLTWSPPATGDPVIGYVIDVGSAPGLTNLLSFATGNAATSLTAGAPTGTYYVRVRAQNASGFSPPSNEIVLVVGVATGGCAGPPRSLVVASQSAGTITLAWQPPETGSPSSYVVVAGSAPGLSNIAQVNTGTTAVTLTVPNVPANSYYVRVHSTSDCGISGPSNEVLVFVVAVGGDVQVSVSWDAPSDVDLHVEEPGGEDIYYGNPSSATGGQLDVDSNAACAIDGRQIENIRWAAGAPGGTYTVRVDYWDACGVGQTNYLVTVTNGPVVQRFTGSLNGPGDHGGFGSGVFITTFTHSASSALRQAAEKMFLRLPPLFAPSPKKIGKQ